MNIIELWNSQADHQNQWESLSEDEKLEFAIAHEREECANIAMKYEPIERHRYVIYASDAIRARSKA